MNPTIPITLIIVGALLVAAPFTYSFILWRSTKACAICSIAPAKRVHVFRHSAYRRGRGVFVHVAFIEQALFRSAPRARV